MHFRNNSQISLLQCLWVIYDFVAGVFGNISSKNGSQVPSYNLMVTSKAHMPTHYVLFFIFHQRRCSFEEPCIGILMAFFRDSSLFFVGFNNFACKLTVNACVTMVK